MIKNKKLNEHLKNHKVQYEYYPHRAIFTVAESKNLDTEIPGMHTKNLFLKDQKNGNFYLVSMNGHKRLNIKKLEEKLQIKKLSFGSPQELADELAVEPGHCSIFAMINSKTCQLIVDEEVWNSKKCGFHPNVNTATLVVDHENLKKFLDSINFQYKYIFTL